MNMPLIQRPRHLIHTLPPKLTFITTNQTQLSKPLSSLLDLCTNLHHLQQIHARFILHGLHQNPTLSSKLIHSYANFGHLCSSQQVLNSITNPSTSLYNTFIGNLYKFGEYEKTLLVYQEMIMTSLYPDENSCSCALRSCFGLSDFKNGKKIHGHLLKIGLDSYDVVGSALVDVYKEFDSSLNAQNPIASKPIDKVVYWNLLIFEAYQNGDFGKSFKFFERMLSERVEADLVTVVNLLRASVEMNSLRLGRYVHGLGVVRGLYEDLAANTALLTMYSKLSSLDDTRLLFEKMPERDCVVWNLMISAYSRNGGAVGSLELLMEMARSGIRADLFTAIPAISSIAQLKALKRGKEMHAHVIRNGSDYQVSVHNTLIDMYCSCDCLTSARRIFDMLADRNVVSWSSIIKGYVSHEQFYVALSLFSKMKLDGHRVDYVIVINILPACVNIGALELVKYLHGYSIKYCLTLIASVNSSLLISYAKCGCIEMARKLFDDEEIDSKDIITWNSMISAYSKYGDRFQCFELYGHMKRSNLKPDPVTFLGLLTSCVNSGSVKEGRECFKDMTERYGWQPNQEHYACMVDLLGRAGNIKEASELINSMPFKPDARVWGPLLSACKMHSEPRLAELAAERLITMEPKNAGNYVLLSNIYAAAGKWDGVAKMRTFLRDRGLKKTPGCSWLDVNGQVHEFRVADKSHPQSNKIYTILGNLEMEIKELRYKSSVKKQF